jgi:hypothetical protein
LIETAIQPFLIQIIHFKSYIYNPCLRKVLLRGQLQGSVSVSVSIPEGYVTVVPLPGTQLEPPFCGAGLVQVLVLAWLPEVELAGQVQLVKVLQLLQPPSVGSKVHMYTSIHHIAAL